MLKKDAILALYRIQMMLGIDSYGVDPVLTDINKRLEILIEDRKKYNDLKTLIFDYVFAIQNADSEYAKELHFKIFGIEKEDFFD